jgi:predicted O-methyltransferase YrrM
MQRLEKLFKHWPGVQSLYDFFKKHRYRQLYDTIRDQKCQKILEIGVWNGAHALKMINEAKKFHGQGVEYYGFDLFEQMTDEVHQIEVAKYPLSESRIQAKLERTGCRIRLFKGYTQTTLPRAVPQLPKMDLIFIDGGHSLETIQSDWINIVSLMHEKTVVIFDDYWNRDDVGCKPIIEKLDRQKYYVEILPIQDTFRKDWGILKINLVKVTKA